mgnify:CR=1 FL=1
MNSLLTINEVIEALGISRATFWRLRQLKDFPTPTMISERSPRWIPEDIDEFIQNNKLN